MHARIQSMSHDYDRTINQFRARDVIGYHSRGKKMGKISVKLFTTPALAAVAEALAAGDLACSALLPSSWRPAAKTCPPPPLVTVRSERPIHARSNSSPTAYAGISHDPPHRCQSAWCSRTGRPSAGCPEWTGRFLTRPQPPCQLTIWRKSRTAW